MPFLITSRIHLNDNFDMTIIVKTFIYVTFSNEMSLTFKKKDYSFCDVMNADSHATRYVFMI